MESTKVMWMSLVCLVLLTVNVLCVVGAQRDILSVEVEESVSREMEESVSRVLVRHRRDLEEIIRNKPIMYAPMIVERVTKSLMKIQEQINTLEVSLLNPDNITTPMPPTTTSTPNPLSSTTLKPTTKPTSSLTSSTATEVPTTEGVTSSKRSSTGQQHNDSRLLDSYLSGHRLFLPILSNSGNAMIRDKVRMPSFEVTSWPLKMKQVDTLAKKESSSANENLELKDGVVSLSFTKSSSYSNSLASRNSDSSASNSDDSFGSSNDDSSSSISNGDPLSLSNGDSLSSNVTDSPTNITTTTASPNVTEAPPPTREDINESLRQILLSSELIMENKFSKDRVQELESSSDKLDEINKFIYLIDVKNDTQTLLYWLVLAKLSTKHSIQRLSEQKATHDYIAKLDDITSLITATFCIIAIAIVAYLIYLISLQRKPYMVNDYESGSNHRSRPNNNNGQFPRESHPPAPVNTRNNPMYSSERSMSEVGPSVNPNTDTVRFEPVSRRTKRDGELAPQPNTHAPDFKDPTRNKKTSLDQYRDGGGGRVNQGFDPDDGVAIRPASESSL